MSYKEKVNKLRDAINQTTAGLEGSCLGLPISCQGLIGIAAPIVILAALYVMSPSIVVSENEETGEQEISYGKLFMWTAIFSIAIWGGMYGYNYYNSSLVRAE